MKTFFSSDLHIGHANIIKYSNRPFTDVNHMHSHIVNTFNYLIGPEDTLYLLGDIGFNKDGAVSKFLARLNTKKIILIIGNHDNESSNKMREAGFMAVLNSASLYVAKQLVTMTHCPLRKVFREDTSKMRNYVAGESWHGETKNQKFSIENCGQFHLHGHTHSTPEKKAMGRQLDIGVDGNNFKPYSLEDIQTWIQRTIGKEQKDANLREVDKMLKMDTSILHKDHEHQYWRTMDQIYPRLCTICNKPEEQICPKD